MNFAALLQAADGWSMHGGNSGWWMAAMIGFWVLFLGAIIVAAVWVARGVGRGSDSPPRQTPSEILDERFAEGVLSVDEYNARREQLTRVAPAHDAT